MELTIAALLIIYFVHISAEDIRIREISNFAPAIVIMSSCFINELSIAERMCGLLFVFIPLLVMNCVTGIGMGDVKLCAAFGFMFGTLPEYAAMLIALIAAGICGKLMKLENGIPFAPFICGADFIIFAAEVILEC